MRADQPWKQDRDRLQRARKLRYRLNSYVTFRAEGSWEWMKEAEEFRSSEYAAMFDLLPATASQRLNKAFRCGLIERRHDPKNKGFYLWSLPPDAEDRLRKI